MQLAPPTLDATLGALSAMITPAVMILATGSLILTTTNRLVRAIDRIRETLPDFELPAQDGRPVRLSEELKRGPVVLFFYPRAMTPGCTTESCDFRDSYTEFAEAGYEVIGVSPDPPSRNLKFKEKEGLNFDLLSDEDLAEWEDAIDEYYELEGRLGSGGDPPRT